MDLEAFSVNGVRQIRARMFVGNLENKSSFLILDPPSHQQSDDLHKKNMVKFVAQQNASISKGIKWKFKRLNFVELLGGWPW